MDFYRKYELIDALPGEGTRSFRAKQVSTAREVTVHLLVGGRTPENEQLLARLRGMPAQSFSKLIEVGDNDGTPYVVTMAPPYQPLLEWLVEQERSGVQAAGKLTQGGAWKMPNAAPTGASPVSPSPVRSAAPPPAPAVPPSAPVVQRPMGATDAFGAPVKPAAPPSAPAGEAPGEFTLMFQTGQKEAASPQRPVGATNALNVPPAKTPAPPTPPAEAGPGEFTRMFQAAGSPPASQPAADPQRFAGATDAFNAPVAKTPGAPSKPVTPPSAPAEPEPGEFTRLFQTGSKTPAQQPVAPQRPMSTTDSFNAPVMKAPSAPSLPAPPASAPAEPEPGEFTRLFQTGSKTPAQQPVNPQRPMSTTDSFNAPVMKAPSGPSMPAPPPSVPAEPGPGEFTRLFQTGSNAPAQQPVTPQRPVGATDSFNTPVAKAPSNAAPPASSEFSKMFANAADSRMPEPSLAPPPHSDAPGEFTKMFNSPLPERPDPKEEWSQPPGKLSDAGTFRRMMPAQPAASPRSDEPPQGGEFTRFFKTPDAGGRAPAQPPAASGFGPSAGSGFGAPNPATPMNPMGPAPAQSPRGQPGEFTRMFGKPGHDPAAESLSPAGGHSPSGATGAFTAPPVQPAGNPYGGAPSGAPGVPPVVAAPAEPQGPSEYTMMINRGQPGGAPGAPAGAPAAPQSGGGGSPMQVQMNVQAPYIPGIQAPHVQMPYVPTPQVHIPGVNVQGPQVPQLHIPQPHIPQPSIPNATLTAKGPSNNTLMIVIFVLAALLIGAVLGVFLKK